MYELSEEDIFQPDKVANMIILLEKIFDNKENSLHKKIISAKIESPNEKIEVLSERCNVEKSIISRHLKIFLDDVKKFLE